MKRNIRFITKLFMASSLVAFMIAGCGGAAEDSSQIENEQIEAESVDVNADESEENEAVIEEPVAEDTAEESKEETPADEDTGTEATDAQDSSAGENNEEAGILTSASDINLTDTTGKGADYTFTYGDETFNAQYKTDNWKIIDSYKIDNEADLLIICQALIDEHPIHGADMESYRTAEDMVYEWVQHNLIYAFLPDDSQWKSSAKDVDLDPKDQNKSFEEMYEERTGKELTLEDIFGN